MTDVRQTATGRSATPAGGTAADVGHPLDNVVWHALRTAQKELAEGDPTGTALRYRHDLSPFHAVDVLDDRAWSALAALAGPDEVVVLFRDEVGAPPPGWTVVLSGVGHQMIAPDDLPVAPPVDGELRPIADEDVDQVLALVALTTPGPFRSRTVDLGGYVGVFDDGRLVALAGERMRCSGHAEISAVCAHPEVRGRGLAAALTLHVAEQIRGRGEVPFLHVATGNDNAIRLYERLGFTHRRLTQFVAIRTPSAGDPR